MNDIIFEYSPGYLLLCLIAGIGYAWLLYRKVGPWGKQFNGLLFTLRAIVVSVLAVLLVSPIIRHIENDVEEPTIVVAVDNSQSIDAVRDSAVQAVFEKRLETITQNLSDDYTIVYRSLSGDKQAAQSTDLSQLLNTIKTDYEGRNLAAVVLVSDGIYNQGVSPTFFDYNFKIHTVGIGDMLPRPDVSITALNYNKVSYQGNRFPLEVKLTHQGYAGQHVKVKVVKEGVLLSQQEVILGADNQLSTLQFIIDAQEKGYQRYEVEVEEKIGEQTLDNNIRQAYIEVVTGREQIAIVALAPHPDIKALKSAIATNANYVVDDYMLSLPEQAQAFDATRKKYDLIIAHHTVVKKGIYEKTPRFTIAPVRGETDRVTGIFNPTFTPFKLSEELQQALADLPPMVVPFVKSPLPAGAEVLLYERVGGIITERPLIVLNTEDDRRMGTMSGEGLWRWKLADYANNGNNKAFNELVVKLVQYLSNKEDKRKFKVYPVKPEFTTSESVIFNNEGYNALYEPTYGHRIALTLTDSEDEKTVYSYVTDENNTRYAITGLPEGVYDYTASTTIDGKQAVVSGAFVIRAWQLENISLTADFNLLRKLAEKSGGSFYQEGELDQLEATITTVPARGIIHSREAYVPFIDLKWLLFGFLVLISAEWFIRKYNGGY